MNLSLRARLLWAVAGITFVAFVLADFAIYSAIGNYLDNQVDSSLQNAHIGIEHVLEGGPPRIGQGPLPVGLGRQGSFGEGGSFQGQFCNLARRSAPGMFVEVLSGAGEVAGDAAGRDYCAAFEPGDRQASPNVQAQALHFSPGQNGEPTEYLTVGATGASGPPFRVRASRLPGGDVLVLATPVSNIRSTMSQLLLVEALVTAGAIGAACALGLWLVRVGLRPLADVERTAQAIAGGDLVHRAPNPNPRTEVGRLAGAFNVMLTRIERLVNDLRSSEARLRRFVGDASHELRTPIAAISGYAQLFEKGAATRPDDLKRAMKGIERESARMSRLVQDLLTLARLDDNRPLPKEPVELVDLVVEARDTALMVGPGYPVRLVASDAVEVMGDRGALRQVIDNLLGNVRAHTPPGTLATVRLAREGDQVLVEVADNGPGITPAQAEMVFERFFRADPSRSRQTGGAGLGLAIVASIVHAHGGQVEAAPAEGGGAVFRVLLPAL